MRNFANMNNRVRRTALAALALLLAAALAACGTVASADSSGASAGASEAEGDAQESDGAQELTAYFVLDYMADGITPYMETGGRYYISTGYAAQLAAASGGLVFTDAGGNVITMAAAGSYTSDTGKALMRVVGRGGTFATAEDALLTVAETENDEEETEEEAGEEEDEDEDASSSGSSSKSGSSSSSGSSSKSSSSSSGSSSSNSSSSDCSHNWVYSYHMTDDIAVYECTKCGGLWLKGGESETEEEETECSHDWVATEKEVDVEEDAVICKKCGMLFFLCDYDGSFSAAVLAWDSHARSVHVSDGGATYTSGYYAYTTETVTVYVCSICGEEKD